jgi:hypothetical protein
MIPHFYFRFMSIILVAHPDSKWAKITVSKKGMESRSTHTARVAVVGAGWW